MGSNKSLLSLAERWVMSALRKFSLIWVAALVPCLAHVRAQDNPPQDRRLAYMQSTAGALAVKSSEIPQAQRLKLVERPLLRYSDPTRGLTEINTLVDAGVWRLGTSGRPTALITLEIYRSSAEEGVLAYEFIALTDQKFSLEHPERKNVAWQPEKSFLEMRPLSGAPAPGKTPAARLVQMRQLARRFSVQETLKGETIECRFLPQPIDRYESEADEILDGAIFAFANGTNPEMGILLECDSAGWKYATVRLSSAATTVKLDGKEVDKYELLINAKPHLSYTSTHHTIELSALE
jgi:hypothetical protein